jgi:hypothetical protein
LAKRLAGLPASGGLYADETLSEIAWLFGWFFAGFFSNRVNDSHIGKGKEHQLA